MRGQPGFAMLIGRSSTRLISARLGTSGANIYRDPVNRGQSTNAAPSPELPDFYTLLRFYSNCATGSVRNVHMNF